MADLPPQTEEPAGLTAESSAIPESKDQSVEEKHDTTYQMLVYALCRCPDDPHRKHDGTYSRESKELASQTPS